jgi:hypothetical protein
LELKVIYKEKKKNTSLKLTFANHLEAPIIDGRIIDHILGLGPQHRKIHGGCHFGAISLKTHQGGAACQHRKKSRY